MRGIVEIFPQAFIIKIDSVTFRTPFDGAEIRDDHPYGVVFACGQAIAPISISDAHRLISHGVLDKRTKKRRNRSKPRQEESAPQKPTNAQ